jgi:hypothetical protein
MVGTPWIPPDIYLKANASGCIKPQGHGVMTAESSSARIQCGPPPEALHHSESYQIKGTEADDERCRPSRSQSMSGPYQHVPGR